MAKSRLSVCVGPSGPHRKDAEKALRVRGVVALKARMSLTIKKMASPTGFEPVTLRLGI